MTTWPEPGQKVRIVTPEQFREGWIRKEGALLQRRPYKPIRQLEDGNWLVQEPDPRRDS